jgi:hypothetical protein
MIAKILNIAGALSPMLVACCQDCAFDRPIDVRWRASEDAGLAGTKLTVDTPYSVRSTKAGIHSVASRDPILLILALSITHMGAKIPIWGSKNGTRALFAYSFPTTAW